MFWGFFYWFYTFPKNKRKGHRCRVELDLPPSQWCLSAVSSIKKKETRNRELRNVLFSRCSLFFCKQVLMTSECVISPQTALGTVHTGTPRGKKKIPLRDFFFFFVFRLHCLKKQLIWHDLLPVSTATWLLLYNNLSVSKATSQSVAYTANMLWCSCTDWCPGNQCILASWSNQSHARQFHLVLEGNLRWGGALKNSPSKLCSKCCDDSAVAVHVECEQSMNVSEESRCWASIWLPICK